MHVPKYRVGSKIALVGHLHLSPGSIDDHFLMVDQLMENVLRGKEAIA